MTLGGNTPWRFKWSHSLALHRLAVRSYNQILKPVPFAIKYGLGQKLRASSNPYRLIQEGWVIVQVGGPLDTLHAGRSRGIHFSLLVGSAGKVIIIEPDPESALMFSALAHKQELIQVCVCQTAVWSEPQTIRVYVNDSHPATSFTDGTKRYSLQQMRDFRPVDLAATTIDDLLASLGVTKVDLVSITTNGAEMPIVHGMRQTMASGLPYISLACTGDSYIDLMKEFGYRFLAHDDRGYTFTQVSQPCDER